MVEGGFYGGLNTEAAYFEGITDDLLNNRNEATRRPY